MTYVDKIENTLAKITIFKENNQQHTTNGIGLVSEALEHTRQHGDTTCLNALVDAVRTPTGLMGTKCKSLVRYLKDTGVVRAKYDKNTKDFETFTCKGWKEKEWVETHLVSTIDPFDYNPEKKDKGPKEFGLKELVSQLEKDKTMKGITSECYAVIDSILVEYKGVLGTTTEEG